MDAQSDLKPICLDPRAYLFFPNGTLLLMQRRSRRLALTKMALDSSSTARSSTKKKLGEFEEFLVKNK